MRVLAMASQKGGSGKTTLSGHLAVQAELSGAGPVCLIDIDPQGSLADWWNEREAEMPAFAQTTVARLASDLEILRQQGFKLAVIDTPPAITMAIQSVIQLAELILIPTRPRPHDLRAVGATVDLCERAGKPLIFVVNAATPKAKITYEAAVALSQHGTVAPITIHHRTDFAASMIDGRTVGEVTPESQSAKEISELWVYLQDRLSRLMHDPTLLPDFKLGHLAVNSLLQTNEESTADMPLVAETPVYEGPERRSGQERRLILEPRPHERRVFGRRATDQVHWGHK